MDTPTTKDHVAAVVALKALPTAKSRMGSLPPAVRARLARVMALDTLAALAPAVHSLVVVSDQPDLAAALDRHGITARVISEPDDGDQAPTGSLNRALDHGADAVLTKTAAVTGVLACVGDLPALRTSSVTQVLAAAGRYPRSFLPDHEDRGTTMLIARRSRLDPRYGTEIGRTGVLGSAERHELSGAARLSLGELPDARWDVDTLDDLEVARRLGLGRSTSAMIDPVSGVVGDYLPVEVVRHDDSSLTVVAQQLTQTVALTAYDGDPALLVPGRRLHAVRVADTVRCWL